MTYSWSKWKKRIKIVIKSLACRIEFSEGDFNGRLECDILGVMRPYPWMSLVSINSSPKSCWISGLSVLFFTPDWKLPSCTKVIKLKNSRRSSMVVKQKITFILRNQYVVICDLLIWCLIYSWLFASLWLLDHFFSASTLTVAVDYGSKWLKIVLYLSSLFVMLKRWIFSAVGSQIDLKIGRDLQVSNSVRVQNVCENYFTNFTNTDKT